MVLDVIKWKFSPSLLRFRAYSSRAAEQADIKSRTFSQLDRSLAPQLEVMPRLTTTMPCAYSGSIASFLSTTSLEMATYMPTTLQDIPKSTGSPSLTIARGSSQRGNLHTGARGKVSSNGRSIPPPQRGFPGFEGPRSPPNTKSE